MARGSVGDGLKDAAQREIAVVCDEAPHGIPNELSPPSYPRDLRGVAVSSLLVNAEKDVTDDLFDYWHRVSL